MATNEMPALQASGSRQYDAISAHRALLRGLVETARVASGARIVQITYLDRERELVESLAWAGFHVGLADSALRMALRLFPSFDPYQVKPRVNHNPCSERVYLAGEPVRAPFDEVAIGAVDHRILALAIGVGKIRESYMYPLRLSGEVFGAMGFHAQEITDAQLDAMQKLGWIAQGTLELLCGQPPASAVTS